MIDRIFSDINRDSEEVSVIKKTKEFAIIEEERIGKKYKITEECLDTDKLLSDNPKLKIYEDRGYKFGDYFEILFNFESMLYYSPEDFKMNIFNIGDVEVQVDHPTVLFDLAMKGFGNDKYYESSSYWTISLKGITEDNYEEYLTKALFLIGYYNQSTTDDQYPECFEFLGEYYYKYAAMRMHLKNVEMHAMNLN